MNKAKSSGGKLLPEAERLAAWAYELLLNARDSAPYPLQGASATWKEGGPWTLHLPPRPRKPRKLKPLKWQETFCKSLAFETTIKRAVKQCDEILARGELKEVLKAGLTHLLAEAISEAQARLVKLADKGSVHAVETLAFFTRAGANELLELSRRKPAVVLPVSQTFPDWPVNYSPHKDCRAELEVLIKRLGIGTASPERVRGKWSNKPASKQAHRDIIGRCANSIGHTLRRIHNDGNLRVVLRHNPHGWPRWIVKLVQLPPLTRKTASDWFAVGWEALNEAARGDVSAIPELSAVGESNAQYRKRREDSATVQKSQRVKQIRVRLRDAFLGRFGT